MKTKKENIAFILSFDKYPTMNSWNNVYGYSFCVKIHSLPLSSKQKDNLYNVISADDTLYHESNADIICEWREEKMKKYGTHAKKKEITLNVENKTAEEIAEKRAYYESLGFAYDRHGTKEMIMHKKVQSPVFDAGFNGRSGGHLVLYRWNGHNYCGTGFAHGAEDLNAMNAEEVKEIADILKDFTALYDILLNNARWYADNASVEDEECTETKTRKVIKINDN